MSCARRYLIRLAPIGQLKMVISTLMWPAQYFVSRTRDTAAEKVGQPCIRGTRGHGTFAHITVMNRCTNPLSVHILYWNNSSHVIIIYVPDDFDFLYDVDDNENNDDGVISTEILSDLDKRVAALNLE